MVIGQKVRPDCADEFLVWQDEMNRVASTFPGFVTAEVTPPTATQPDWVVVYRFDSVANLQAWLNSVARHDRLAAGRDYLDGNPTQQVIAGAATPPDQLVTVVVTTASTRPGSRSSWPGRTGCATRRPGFPVTGARSCSGPSRDCRTNGRPCTATTRPPTSTPG